MQNWTPDLNLICENEQINTILYDISSAALINAVTTRQSRCVRARGDQHCL